MDERLEELNEILFDEEKPALNAHPAIRYLMKTVLSVLWNAPYLTCRGMCFDTVAVRKIVFLNILPEHVQRTVGRFRVYDLMNRPLSVAEELFDEIICGSAVMEFAGEYCGHAWRRNSDRTRRASEVIADRKNRKILSSAE